jgi:drug/metabolite transporter (DMT)-like permease
LITFVTRFRKMDKAKVIKAHVSVFSACLIWGLMSPICKDAMLNGISGIDVVAFRVVGAAALFWIASLFTKPTKVAKRDLLMIALAALLGLVCNQCCFTIGLSITSPVNASIVTTSLPIITMILAAIFLHEPVTSKKVIGIFCGAAGALILIMGSASAANVKAGDIRGDLLCLLSQFSFACYLAIFKKLIQRYDVVTFQKWMFVFGAIMVLPVSFTHVAAIPWAQISIKTWLEIAFVVVGSTFFAYILMMIGQKSLRPTVISMYSYVQPIVACVVSVIAGLGIFGWGQSFATVLIFVGVYLVIMSKSRSEMNSEAVKKE